MEHAHENNAVMTVEQLGQVHLSTSKVEVDDHKIRLITDVDCPYCVKTLKAKLG